MAPSVGLRLFYGDGSLAGAARFISFLCSIFAGVLLQREHEPNALSIIDCIIDDEHRRD